MADQTDETTPGPTRSKCDNAPAGPGGILCPGCMAATKSQTLHSVEQA